MSEREVWREFVRRARLGGPWGSLAVVMLFMAGSAFAYPKPEGACVPLVTAAMAEAYGDPVSAAFVQIFWSGLLGAALGTMEVPFLLERRTLFWSAVHFLATAAVSSLAGGRCRWFPYVDTWLCLLGLLFLCYVLKWLVRFLEWQADVLAIRRSSGLEAAEPPWRTLAPYLLLAAAVELLLPPGLMLADARDFPVLTGIFYPFLILPLSCFFGACPLGRRLRRWWLAYPPACAALTLPCVFLVYNHTALFQVWAAGLSALAGGLLGMALREKKKL